AAEQPVTAKAKPAPIAALAYSPDGKYLAAGAHGEVLVIDVASGDIATKLTGQAAKVTALAFNKDGSRLAVASGTPAKSGEVRIYSVAPNGLPNAKADHVLDAHSDLVYAVAFNPDGKTLTTAGYDRVIKLWDVASGKEANSLKDHSDTI